MLTYPPPRPNFVPFAIFELRLFFQKSAPNDLDMFKVKNTNIHAIYMYTDKGQIFVSFALQWAVLELRPNFGKAHRMTPNDLDMFKIKYTNMHVTYTPEAQIFVCFALWAIFELRSYFRKSE